MSGVRGRNGLAVLPDWEELEQQVPAITATMRRYLTQIGCVLRPGSVVNTGIALRAFAAFLVENTEVRDVSEVTRRHIEDYKPWLAQRPGRGLARVVAQVVQELAQVEAVPALVPRLALAEEVDEMRLQSATYDQAAPTSDAGKAAIKDGKEKYRVRTR